MLFICSFKWFFLTRSLSLQSNYPQGFGSYQNVGGYGGFSLNFNMGFTNSGPPPPPMGGFGGFGGGMFGGGGFNQPSGYSNHGGFCKCNRIPS